MNRKFSQQIAGNMGYRLPTAFDQVSTKFTTIQVYIQILSHKRQISHLQEKFKDCQQVMISPNFSNAM